VRQAILRAWPWAESDPAAAIFLIPNVQCHGETPRDLDLVILASLPTERATFAPTVQLKLLDDRVVEPDLVHVRSLCIVIEVKDNAPQDVRFSGPKVEVRYHGPASNDRWHSATKQNEGQKYSLMRYLARHTSAARGPHITNLIWLRNVTRDALPRGAHNVLPATITWSALLNTVAANSCVWPETVGITLAATTPESAFSFAAACDLLTRRLTPTTLDRRRMDRIANAVIQDAWLEELGKRQMTFEGRGGTGKTMILLGLAWRIQERQRARVLVLTYNRALVADFRRTLALMGLTDDFGEPTIEVQTVHSFLFWLLKTLGLLNREEEGFLERFDEYKTEVLSLLRDRALTQADIQEATKQAPERLDWDYVFVDEAQDWPQDERDILHLLYPPSHFVIADGRDQLVRRDEHCDWSAGPERIPTRRFVLERGVRMKANLARFANQLAEHLDLATWSIQQNSEAIGGKVLVVEGDYAGARTAHEAIMAAARSAGNAPVDLLTCVPPGMVVSDSAGRHSSAALLFETWGYAVWDGVREDLRRTYPTSVDQLRIVQYDSCRGLEGWAVVNLGIDEFYDYKVAAWAQPSVGSLSATVDDATLARRFAARWLMIPCSRAIDTLVLHVRSRTTFLGNALHSVCGRCDDFAEWITV